ncbi:hypothetical protein L195_g039520, partial [Trifolium pratense]
SYNGNNECITALNIDLVANNYTLPPAKPVAIFKIMDEVVENEKVGEDNVVQVVTDNVINYKAASEKARGCIGCLVVLT